MSRNSVGFANKHFGNAEMLAEFSLTGNKKSDISQIYLERILISKSSALRMDILNFFFASFQRENKTSACHLVLTSWKNSRLILLFTQFLLFSSSSSYLIQYSNSPQFLRPLCIKSKLNLSVISPNFYSSFLNS